MSRVRLTKRVQANDPGDMDGSRQKIQPKIDTYSNFDPAKDDVGDRKVKMWKEDPKLRDEMHVTKMKQAKMWQASKLATKLAIYLLGEKAPSNMIKAQAAEFLSLGNARLAKAVSRFASTEYLYAEDEEEMEKPTETANAEDEKEVEKVENASDEPDDEEKIEKMDASEEEKVEVEEKVEEAGNDEEVEEASDDDEKTEEDDDEEIETEEDLVEEASDDDDEEEISDEEIASIFADNSNDVVAKKTVKKSAKKGVQTMVQPSKVASSQQTYMSELWAGAPDVSDVFN